MSPLLSSPRNLSSLAEAVQVFDSEQAVLDFIASAHYEDVGVGHKGGRGASAEETRPTPTPSRDGHGDARREELARSGKRFRGAGGGGTGAGGSADTEAEELRDAGVKPGDGKIAMAVIFNKAPADGGPASWDYTLRLNFTYEVARFQDQVSGGFPI